jgi:hypothetical protein
MVAKFLRWIPESSLLESSDGDRTLPNSGKNFQISADSDLFCLVPAMVAGF